MASVPGPNLLLTLLTKRRLGTLHPDERGVYRATVDDYLQRVLAKQNALSRTTRGPRRDVRAARSVEVDLTDRRVSGRCLSLDIGFGGFSALLAEPLTLDDSFAARLRLRGEEWISPRVQVASVQRRCGAYRVSFSFVALSAGDRDLLELAILSDLLGKIAPAPRAPSRTDMGAMSDRKLRCTA